MLEKFQRQLQKDCKQFGLTNVQRKENGNKKLKINEQKAEGKEAYKKQDRKKAESYYKYFKNYNKCRCTTLTTQKTQIVTLD